MQEMTDLQARSKSPLAPWPEGPALRKAVLELSGTQLLNGILELPNAREVVMELAPTDFYWIVKKIGEDDSLPLLELASCEQWQHLLDLEVWRKDRVEISSAGEWLKRLHMADPDRLAKWILEEGDLFARFYLGRLLEVFVRDHDTDEVPDGFFSLDGVYYLRVKDPNEEKWIQELLADIARLDYGGYLRILVGMAEYLPSEAEEELYRLRNVRIAEQGFLPFEEALRVYAPLEPEAVIEGVEEVPPALEIDDEQRDLVPMIPLDQGIQGGLLAQALSRFDDPLFIDRVRLEFAALANEILSADGMPIMELEVMKKAWVRAASYLNLGLERLTKGDIDKAQRLISDRALVSIFRVGFGAALEVQRRARRWLKDSWFRKMGLGLAFWGEPWGSCLEGLLKRRPRYYAGEREVEAFRDFIRLSEVEETSKILSRLMALDSLLDILVRRYPLDPGLLANPEAAFQPLLFNLWARWVLGRGLEISKLAIAEARSFFGRLREGEKRPPYKMRGWEEKFVAFFMGHVEEEEREGILQQTLSLLWSEFREEYERVPTEELDPRFSRLLALA